MKPIVYQSPVAVSVPMDNSSARGYSSTEVQSALEELRDHTVYISRTQALSINGTLTLTSNDKNLQYLTGSGTGYSVILPSATTITTGSLYQIINTTAETVTVKDGASTALFTLSQNSVGYMYLQVSSSIAGTWIYFQVLANSTASGIINYNLVSSTNFSTSSITDVIITGFTLTPQAGTYAVWWNGNIRISSGTATETTTIYKDGVTLADTVRSIRMAAANQPVTASSMTVATFNGSQSCDVRVRTSAATVTVAERSMILIRLGP